MKEELEKRKIEFENFMISFVEEINKLNKGVIRNKHNIYLLKMHKININKNSFDILKYKISEFIKKLEKLKNEIENNKT